MLRVFVAATLSCVVFLSADDNEPKKKKPERVIPAREVLETGEVVELLKLGKDERWHVLDEKAPFTGKVIDTIFGRQFETTYLKGLKHGPYTTWHKNGVVSSSGVYEKGKRVRHKEWDLEGGQIELANWNFDGSPKVKPPKKD